MSDCAPDGLMAAGSVKTTEFITEGADVIFPVAGGVGLGGAKAVQNAGAALLSNWVEGL